MAGQYQRRSRALWEMAHGLHRALSYTAVRGTIADKMLLIDVTVETLNKSLYMFQVSSVMLEGIDEQLNRHYLGLRPHPRQVNRLFYRCLRLARDFETHATRWRDHYGGTT